MGFVALGPSALPVACSRGAPLRAGHRRTRRRSRATPQRRGQLGLSRSSWTRHSDWLAVHAGVTEVINESYAMTVGSGILLALVSGLLWTEWVRKKGSKDQKSVNRLEKEQAEMQQKLEGLQQELQESCGRVAVLESARAAAVGDVTQALGQKRDAEFALAEAQDRIRGLEQGAIHSQETGEETQTVEEVVDAAMQALPEELKDQIGDHDVEALHQWLTKFVESGWRSSSAMHASDVDSYVKQLEDALKEQKRKMRDANVEVATIKDFAKTELRSMTEDLIKGRDEAKELREQIAELEYSLSKMKPRLAKADSVIKNLQQLLAKSGIQPEKVTSSITEAHMTYGHKMRADAAHMVEKIEDKAAADVDKIMQREQSAQQRALKEYLEAAKAQDREQKLRRNLADAQEQIKEKALEVKYLTELLQILSSKEAQENAEEQSLKQNDSLWNED